MTQPVERHDVVYCAPARLSQEAIHTPHSQDIGTIHDWIRAGRPFIARTRRDQDRAGWIALGLPLPPSLGKKRIALEAEPSLVQAIEPPPLLRDVIDILPTRWQERIETLCANLTPHTASVRVVGSLAWQYLAGTAYLHPQSDIDVILRVTDFSKVGTLLDILADSDLARGPRIDGEMVTPAGEAVAWRELLDSSREILVKNIDGPRIVLRETWLNSLREPAT